MAELYVTLRTHSITKGPRSDEPRDGFTDSEALFPTCLGLAFQRPGMPKRAIGVAPGAVADRKRPPAVPGHQGGRPGTSGAT